MNPRKTAAAVLLSASAMVCVSCTSMSQEQLTENERSRLQQERKGYFDREKSEHEKKADDRRRLEELRRKT
jgi:hypothetical protein